MTQQTPQQQRKLIEQVQILTGERGAAGDRAVRVKDLEATDKLGASYRARAGVIRKDLDDLTATVTDQGSRIAALEAGGGGGGGRFTVDGNDIEGEGGLLFIDLEQT